LLLALCCLLFATPVTAQQGPTNLLVNGDFEWWDWNVRSWPLQDGISEIQVCPGWRAFYVDTPPAGVTAPESWKRPEFRDAKTAEFSYRVRSGSLAQKYFTFGGQHQAGLYQQVSGIVPGTPLRFSVYMQTWGCMAGTDSWNICPTGEKSNNPPPMHTRAGIDPTGGTDPWSPGVIWSPEINAYDVWTLFQVEAVAENSTVTVFTYSFADWFDHVFRINNDVYIDDASLIALNEVLPTATQPPATEPPTPDAALPSPTSGPTATSLPTATPFATATPRSDGAIVHVVQAGETLSIIANLYQVPQETLIELNAIANANILEVGQDLIIVAPNATETPTPLPPTSLPVVTPTATPAASPTPIPPSATPTPVSVVRATTIPTSTPLPPIDESASKTSLSPLGGFFIGAGFLLVAVAVFIFVRELLRR